MPMNKIYPKKTLVIKNSVNHKLSGFTLIELLVVVLIIGILAAIALPQYERSVERARAAEAVSMLRSMRDAQNLCVLATGDGAKCTAADFFKNSSFQPPSAVLPGTSCPDGLDCFETKDWTYWSEDYLYAARIKGGEWVATLSTSPRNLYDQEEVECSNRNGGDYCKQIGM